jgi:hypothetical protein
MDTTHPVAVGPVYDAGSIGRLLHVVYNEELFNSFGEPPEPLPGFITFFDPGLNVLGLRAVLEFLGKQVFVQQPWYIKELFGKVAEEPRYRQLQMEPVKDSFGKTFAEQQALVPPGEEIPTARVVLTTMAIHFLATGDRLFSDDWIRCVDQTSFGAVVYVGFFDPAGVLVSYWGQGRSDGDLGVVLARKF